MNCILKVSHFRVFLSALFCVALLMPTSCTNDDVTSQASENSAELERVANKLNAAGFDTSEGFRKYKDGYLVEYDIFLTEEMIDECVTSHETYSNGRTQRYVTNNLVTVSGTRTVQIFLGAGLNAAVQTALTTAINRYNKLNLGLRFQRTSTQSAADIRIVAVSNIYGPIASAGFPTGGNPYHTIELNTYYFNSTPLRADAASIIAHEIGHAIGFRHTDFMNTTFSCGSLGWSEGDAGVGANHVPGTPTEPSDNSWMLACANGVDRPFTPDDRNALRTVYPRQPIPQTWDVVITASPIGFVSSYCNYKFGTVWTICPGSGTSAGAIDEVVILNGLGFNPTQCTWNALYGPTTCSFPHPGSPSPSPMTRSFTLSPASGSGVQYVTLTYGTTTVWLTVQYVYNP